MTALLDDIEAGVFDPNNSRFADDAPVIQRTVGLLQELGERVSDARLVANFIAHEIRRSLGTAADYIDRANRAAGSAEIGQHLRQARASLDDLDEGMVALLRLARDGGPPPRRVSLSHVCQLVFDELRGVGEAKHLTLLGRIAPGVIVSGDEQGLISIVRNLLDNAIKYTRVGEVALDLRMIDRVRFTLTITDSGPGLSLADHSKVTKPFFRGEGAAAQEGYGLGLSLVRRLTRRYGFAFVIRNGTVGAEARVTGPTVGTT